VLKVVETARSGQVLPSDVPAGSLLDEIAREGARRMLAAALKAEADAYVDALTDELDEAGHRLVVRNGHHDPRTVSTAAGAIEVRAPRVNDMRVDETSERKRFASAILPAWCRRSPKISEVLPLLYLHGLSGGDFVPALEQFLGTGAGLSASTITRLCEQWQDEQRLFAKRDLSGVDYVYVWADGIHVNIRLEEHKLCLLVLIGVRTDGSKELITLTDGYRESVESWADLLRDAKRRGMRAPVLAVGDGALGFWGGLREVFPETREQRCWFHRDCKESTWRCRGVVGRCGRVEEGGGSSEPVGSRGGAVSVLGQDGGDLADDVTDGASADLEQVGEGVLAA
jgi:transposase-like protein